MRVRPRSLLLALLTVAVVVTGCSSGGGKRPAEPSGKLGQSMDAPMPAGVLTAPLIDSTGALRPLSSFAGKVLVISDSMTLCQETCPIDTAGMLEAARAADKAGLADKLEFVTITVDPKRDTPAQLAAYRKLYAPDPANWVSLTGPVARVSQLWKELGVYIQQVPEDSPAPRNWRTGQTLTYDIDHSDELFFVDPNGHERFLLDGAPHINSSSAVPAALYKFMDADGHKNVNDPAPGAWTVPQALSVISWLTGKEVS